MIGKFSNIYKNRYLWVNTNTNMAIAKKIVEISGARITSHSQIGIDSTFLFICSN